MFPFVINREWNGKPITLTAHNWVMAQFLKECSDKELSEYLSDKMILG